MKLICIDDLPSVFLGRAATRAHPAKQKWLNYGQPKSLDEAGVLALILQSLGERYRCSMTGGDSVWGMGMG